MHHKTVPASKETIPMIDAVDRLARELMRTECPFEGVSGDFDRCSSSTRNAYEAKAAEAFGISPDEYWDLRDRGTPRQHPVDLATVISERDDAQERIYVARAHLEAHQRGESGLPFAPASKVIRPGLEALDGARAKVPGFFATDQLLALADDLSAQARATGDDPEKARRLEDEAAAIREAVEKRAGRSSCARTGRQPRTDGDLLQGRPGHQCPGCEDCEPHVSPKTKRDLRANWLDRIADCIEDARGWGGSDADRGLLRELATEIRYDEPLVGGPVALPDQVKDRLQGRPLLSRSEGTLNSDDPKCRPRRS